LKPSRQIKKLNKIDYLFGELMQVTYCIDQSIFQTIPGYQRGIVLGFDIVNGFTPQSVTDAIRKQEEVLRANINLSDILQNPHIAAWRESYRLAGIKPADYRPSIEGLVRRVLRGEMLPSINCIVDIGTYLSIKYLLPIGAHAVDHLQEGMTLRKAAGNETFEAFGSTVLEKPDADEFIFTDGNQIMTRRWTWRQAKHSIIEPTTKAVEFNIDALGHISTEEIETISTETRQMLEIYCQGKCRSTILNEIDSCLQFNYP
jgi:DNA/RNA-binding domain of Phe-tRNA-synthetase-like protein